MVNLFRKGPALKGPVFESTKHKKKCKISSELAQVNLLY